MAILDKFINDKVVSPLYKKIKASEQRKTKKLEKADKALSFDTSLFENIDMTFGSFSHKPGSEIDFETLREFSVMYDIARACINKRKNQVTQLKWNIVSQDESGNENAINQITEFFKNPMGKERSMEDMNKMIIEDLIVLDGVAMYKVMNNDGTLNKLWPIDASTIRLKIDKSGMLPEPPETAYQQVIDGRVVEEYTTDELIYEMSNPRTNSPYGLSPLESLILDIQTTLKVQLYNLAHFTSGNIPPGFIQAPEGWDVNQIKKYERWLNEGAGNDGQRHKIKVIPSNSKYETANQMSEMFFKELELMIMKKTCAMLGVTPTEIGFTDDVNKATSEGQIEVSKSLSLKPTVNFLEEIYNRIIREHFNTDQLEFRFDLETENKKDIAESAQKLVPIGVQGIDEVRQELGLDPIGVDNYVLNATGMQFIDSESENQEQQEIPVVGAKKELITWRKRCLRDLKYNRDINRNFNCDHINDAIKVEIRQNLKKAQGKEEIAKIFNTHIDNQSNEIVKAAIELKDKLNKSLENEAQQTQVAS